MEIIKCEVGGELGPDRMLRFRLRYEIEMMVCNRGRRRKKKKKEEEGRMKSTWKEIASIEIEYSYQLLCL